MKLTVQLQLLPDTDAAEKLRAMVERFNDAANWIAGECFERREANQYRVRTFAYHEVRQRFGLSSQMAQLAIKNVCDVYKRDKTKRPTFRAHAAISRSAIQSTRLRHTWWKTDQYVKVKSRCRMIFDGFMFLPPCPVGASYVAPYAACFG